MSSKLCIIYNPVYKSSERETVQRLNPRLNAWKLQWQQNIFVAIVWSWSLSKGINKTQRYGQIFHIYNEATMIFCDPGLFKKKRKLYWSLCYKVENTYCKQYMFVCLCTKCGELITIVYSRKKSTGPVDLKKKNS